MEIDDPSGEPSGISLKLAGAHSERYRRSIARVQAKQQNRQLKRRSAEMTEEDLAFDFDLMTDHFIAITLDWKGAESKGKPLEFNADNLRYLYENAIDVRNQVTAFTRDARRFLSQSSNEQSG